MSDNGSRENSQEPPQGGQSTLGKRHADSPPTGRTNLSGFHFKKYSQQESERTQTQSPQPMEEEADGHGGGGAGRKEQPTPPVTFVSRRAFTPRPAGGFPEIVGHNKETVFTGMGLQHRKDLNECDDENKFFVYTDPPSCDRRPTAVAKIAGVVNDIAPVEGVVLEVAPPVLAEGTDYDDYDEVLTPKMYLVTGATDKQRAYILDGRVWSCDELTLIAIPFAPPIDNFLFILSGYTLPSTPQAAVTVTKAIQRAIFAKEAVGYFLITCYFKQFDGTPDNEYDSANANKWAEGIVQSIRVKAETVDAGDMKQVQWRVYGTPPSQAVDDHKAWLTMLRKIDYMIALKGRPMVYRFDKPKERCGGCMSVDHRTGRCALPDVQGWKGKERKTRLVQAEIQIKLDRSDEDDRKGSRRGRTRDDRTNEDKRGGKESKRSKREEKPARKGKPY
ncbi:hypothetical protein GGG16DRAFT_113803 [Schizophyllum commune]|nr:hypothetical protein K525DRAFT_271089 [Schizophyllum commune Loenen D]